MYNELSTKKSSVVAIVLAAVISLCACSGKKEANPEALSMLNQAKELINTDPAMAITMLDSLCKSFPGELDLVKESMYLNTLAQENFLNREEAKADSIIQVDSATYARLQPQFVFVKEKDMVEGYFVHRSIKGNPLFARTGIEPRYYEGSSDLVVVSMLRGASVAHTHLTASAAAGSESTADVPYDKSTNYRYNDDGVNTEMVTFHQDECQAFCKFISDNIGSQIKVTFVGKGKQAITLNDALRKAIAETYQFAMAQQRGRDAVAMKAKIAKMKKINANHKERTAQALEAK